MACVHGLCHAKNSKSNVSVTANDEVDLEERETFCKKFNELQGPDKSFVILDETKHDLICTQTTH